LRIGSFDRREQENWLFRAFGIFIVGLTLWILVALTLSSANAGTLSLLADLSSKLKASYGIDLFGNSMGSLQLSIIEDAWRDGGGSPFGEDDPGDVVAQIVGSPVPTATLTGDERVSQPTQPPTRTVETSPTPTPSPTITATASPTASSSPTPTATEGSDSSGGNDGPTETPSPTPSKTPKPTNTPYPSKTPTPSKTPEPSETPKPTSTYTPSATEPPEEPTDVPPPTDTPLPDGTPSGPTKPTT
jgi:hypothetical protein